MSVKKDDQIAQAYGVFGCQHDRLRSELLARLAQESAGVSGHGSAARGQGRRVDRWIVGSALGMAAMLLVGVTAWKLLAPSNPGGSGALISSHVSMVKSLVIRGWYDDLESRPSP